MKTATSLRTLSKHHEELDRISEEFPVKILEIALQLQYADRRDVQVIVPVTDRVVDVPIALTGTLRGVEINRDDGTLAEVTKN